MSKDFRIYARRFMVFSLIVSLFSASPAAAQTENMKWKLNLNFAGMKPFVRNDQWFVTPEGYHIHPRTEDFTPGLSLGIERSLSEAISLELSILYGLPPATLGVIDQFSPSGREFEGTERYHFLAFMLSPNLYWIRGRFGGIYVGPAVGYGMLSKKTISPSFGPEVTWTGEGKLIYGIKTGVKFRLKNPSIFFNTECLLLSMKTRLEQVQTGRELEKTFGPFGILLGISYAFD